MKLSQNQIQKIETYLDFKELIQVDLRNEVMDHMATEIERSMGEKELDFNEALNQSITNWNLELADYSSWWIGWAWVGPKLMMQKAVKKTKQIYLRTILGIAVLMALFHLIYKVFDVSVFYETFNIVLGISYVIFLGLLLFGHFRIKNSDYHTSYRFLFKIHAIGFAFMYFVYNPIWNDSMMIFDLNPNYLWILFFHSFLISFAYTFWDLYQAHFKAKKYVVS